MNFLILSFPFYIAKKYLFSKTSNNAINIITIIASFGVIIGSLALFIVLSGFSGLRVFSYSLLDVSDPDIKITTTVGKSFFITQNLQNKLTNNILIKETSKVIVERVFLEYNEKTEIAFIKGVEDNYTKISNIDSSLTVGTWLQKDFSNTAVIGRGISNKLSLGILNYGVPLKIMIPKPSKGFINPINPFYKIETQIVGVYRGTEEFESKYVFTSLVQARNLLHYKENQVTAIELKLYLSQDSEKVAGQLREKFGANFKVQTKEQLNALFYKVINTETLFLI